MWRFDLFAENTAIITEGGIEVAYSELEYEGAKLAASIGRRCLVFVLCCNEKGALLGYTSFLNNNIVPLMLDAALERELLFGLIEAYKPDFIWLPHQMVEEFPDYPCTFSAWDYSLIKLPYIKEYVLNNELALLLTTSGSTGSPKLVRQSYKNIRANTESIVSYLKLTASERPITTMPMSYTYGLSIINSHLWVGASIILTQKMIMDKEFWTEFKSFCATSFGGVPYIYEMLDKLRLYQMDLPSLQTMTQAGGKLPPDLHRKIAEFAQASGRKFFVMYGQTEATARMSYLPSEKSLEKYGSMGIAIPGGDFELIDTNGEKIHESEIVGELVYKGENVTLGYAECGSDLSKGDEFSGVLITGDMAKRDCDGYYYITGRKKRFLKLFGSRVNLDETERLLDNKFENFEFACGGVDDKMTVFITDSGKAAQVIDFLVEKTGFHHTAFIVVTVERIPRNEAGKILYSELNDLVD
jgi:acyl-coenzyme A synthetase/AMP-(fatty) acid ligase